MEDSVITLLDDPAQRTRLATEIMMENRRTRHMYYVLSSESTTKKEVSNDSSDVDASIAKHFTLTQYK